MDYKKLIVERVSKLAGIESENVEKFIEIPPKGEMGDYAFPCFQLAKTMRKAPNMIAKDLQEKIEKDGFEKIENLGPYLNFFIDKSTFSEEIIKKVNEEGDMYGSSDYGKNRNVTIDYSSPNIAKPFHIGHLYSTSIGFALHEIFKFEGFNPIGINHLGDWGTQFGKLIVAYENWVNLDDLHKDPINEMLRIYVKFHEEAKEKPELEDEARKHFKNLEDNCEYETELWHKFVDLSLKEFKKVYDMLGIEFEHYTGESFYNDKMDAIVEKIDSKGLLTESNGAKVVMLDDYNMPPCIIKKSDGATIYATRDLAAATYRHNTYDFYKNIYVVGTPQALHFKQFFKVLELMGDTWSQGCVHVGFGLVKFTDRKLSTRNGDVVFLEDVLKESVKRTLEIINEKSPNLENKEDAAKKIGIGAIVFAFLKNNRERDIVFDWNEMLNFEGETGPYVQYTYARGKSILRKAGEISKDIDYSLLSSKEEFELIKLLASFNDSIMMAIEKYEPSIITRHIIEVAKAFNRFYNQYKILNTEDIKLRDARLKLVSATCHVIKNGLKLIGVNVVEKM